MSKQVEKWKVEIKELERKIPELETFLEDHQKTLIKDMTIDFYEIQRRQEGGLKLIADIKAAKKRINLLILKI